MRLNSPLTCLPATDNFGSCSSRFRAVCDSISWSLPASMGQRKLPDFPQSVGFSEGLPLLYAADRVLAIEHLSRALPWAFGYYSGSVAIQAERCRPPATGHPVMTQVRRNDLVRSPFRPFVPR